MTKVAHKTQFYFQNCCGKRHPYQKLSEELKGTYKSGQRKNNPKEEYNLAATQMILQECAVGRRQNAPNFPVWSQQVLTTENKRKGSSRLLSSGAA